MPYSSAQEEAGLLRRTHFFTFGLLVLLFAWVRVEALYMEVDIETVPVERLIRNLEQLVSQAPNNLQIRFNLARVHAMAFAQKMRPGDSIEIQKDHEAEGAWFGHEPDFVPFKAAPTNDPALLSSAKAHLSQAINLYREVVQQDPANMAAKLGYAWCLDQSGDRTLAISAYRQVISDGWAKEQIVVAKHEAARNMRPIDNGDGTITISLDSLFVGRLGSDSVTIEAAGYLLPLLDREKDKDEIATLKDRIRLIGQLPRGITPIAIPLRDNARSSDLVDREARVRFDADGTGFRRPWTWITPDAGWLVHAPKKSRPVTSALQMFGSVTFWLFWQNGYQALQSLDDNGDGTLTGKELEGLALWRDSNSNGVSETGEVKPLADWGIVALSCRHEVNNTHPDYVATSPRGVTFEDGRTRPTYDILLYAHEQKPVTSD